MLMRSTSFKRDERGLSGVEFALIAPTLIMLLLGGYEVQRYVTIDRQLSTTAMTIAEITAQEEGPLEPWQPNLHLDIAIHTFPEASRDPTRIWWHVLVHQISHVVFKPNQTGCTVGCEYNAEMAWIWPVYQTGVGWGGLRRQCGPVPLTEENENGSPGLPAAMAGPGSMVIVDLKYQFTPMFGSRFFPSITMIRHGYAASQFAHPYIVFRSDRNVICPGY